MVFSRTKYGVMNVHVRLWCHKHVDKMSQTKCADTEKVLQTIKLV